LGTGGLQVVIIAKGRYNTTFLMSSTNILPSAATVRRYLHRFPVTLGCIALSVAGFLLVMVDPHYQLIRYLSYFDFQQFGRAVVFSSPEGQYWRLLTPTFLHFSFIHLAFNVALLWFVGYRIELLQGSMRLLIIVIATALCANVLQAILGPPALFGGISGVVFGLLGYAWLWSLLRPQQSLQVPPAIVYFLVAMMALGFVGFAQLFGFGAIANIAHLAGFVMGLIIAVVAVFIDTIWPRSRHGR
jgi:GlpG protein